MNKEIEKAIEQLQHTISIYEDIEDEGNLEIDFNDIVSIRILVEHLRELELDKQELIEELEEKIRYFEENEEFIEGLYKCCSEGTVVAIFLKKFRDVLSIVKGEK